MMATPEEKIEALKRAVSLMDAGIDFPHRTALAEIIHDLTVNTNVDTVTDTGGIHCDACGYFTPLGLPPLPNTTCQCGAAKVKDSTHADWCPANINETLARLLGGN